MKEVDAAVEKILPGERFDRFTMTRTRTGIGFEVVGFGRRFLLDFKTRSYGHSDSNEDRRGVPDD